MSADRDKATIDEIRGAIRIFADANATPAPLAVIKKSDSSDRTLKLLVRFWQQPKRFDFSALLKMLEPVSSVQYTDTHGSLIIEGMTKTGRFVSVEFTIAFVTFDPSNFRQPIEQ